MAIVKTPTQIREEQTQGFLSLLNEIKSRVNEDKVNLKNIVLQLNGILERFYDSYDTQLATADKLKRHILILERKKCETISSEPRCNYHDIAEDTRSLCDTIISEVKALGLPARKNVNDKSVNVNTTVTQNQEQNQNQSQEVKLAIKILLDAVKDDLTGKQRKELVAIAKDAATPEEAHKGILEKLKEFGSNVSASIVANILTNPQVWEAIGSIV